MSAARNIGIVLVLAAAVAFIPGGGTIVWILLLAGAAYAIYLVWRHHREYG